MTGKIKIKDFGERILGARKDLWREWNHLEEFSEEELEAYVKRDYIWPLPDAKRQVANGMDPFIAYWQRMVRRRITPVPRVLAGTSKLDCRKNYVQMILTVKELVLAVDDMKGILSFYEKARDKFGMEDKFWFAFSKSLYSQKYELASMRNRMEAMNFPEGNGRKKVQKKKTFIPPQLTEIHREGPDYRKGRHVNAEVWQKVFQFRGVQFGNWMSQKDRQYSMDYCFDALKDLARVLNISCKDIAFQNRLALSFGARGHSNASAHYEVIQKVINLTKMHGAGCTAHEWFHALDHLLANHYGITDAQLASMTKQTHLLPPVYATLCKSMKTDSIGGTTDYLRGSRLFDITYRKDAYGYWSSTQEMLARAFACYVKDTLGKPSDYLIAHADTYVFQYENQRACAIPQGEERELYNELFDQLFFFLKQEGILHDPEPEGIPEVYDVNLKNSVAYPELTEELGGQYTLFAYM